MKNPLKQMKQVQKGMALMMYEIYCAGYSDGSANVKPVLSLKEFANEVKEIHKRGKVIAKEAVLNANRTNPVNDAQKSP